MPIIENAKLNHGLIEKQGEHLFKNYLIDVLGYDEYFIRSKSRYKNSFSSALKRYDSGYIRYETDENGEKILLGFILTLYPMFSRHHLFFISE